MQLYLIVWLHSPGSPGSYATLRHASPAGKTTRRNEPLSQRGGIGVTALPFMCMLRASRRITELVQQDFLPVDPFLSNI